jgi:arsenical pump membrane protein
MLAGGSRARLFALIYGLGAAVTIFLSNDATVILLTPAIFAIVGDGVGDALPYLFACALVANAASFTLSISNPANLVIFGHALPRLFPWMQFFGLSAVASMAVTFVALCWYFRRELRGSFVATSERTVLGVRGRLAVCLTVLAAIALVAAAATGISVGLVALGSALVAVAAEVVVDRSTARYVASHIAWQVVPLVAGLFVVVAGLERVGATADIQRLFAHASSYGEPAGAIAIGGATALASDLFNNLPVALAGGVAVTDGTISPLHAHAMTVAINLGSNFATTGSLATLLWLILLRQHKVTVTPLQFFRVGAFVTVPALLAALLLVR